MSADGIGALERGTRRWPRRDTVALLIEALDLNPTEARELELAASRPRLPAGPRDVSVIAPLSDDSAASARSNNLPFAFKTLVGRDSEVGEIAALVQTERLLTITGSGGIGKTSAALEVGSTMLDRMADGVWLVELAPLRDASLVAATVARTLGVQELPSRTQLETLVAYLKAKTALLILDNCEHVVAEAATVASVLLRGCAGLRIVATSREALKIPGEQLYRLPSLGVPPPDALSALTAADALKYGAVALFAERARAADFHFTLTDAEASTACEICRRLDGIPLAIELAAARVTVLSLKALYGRLDQRFRLLSGGARTALPRQQTMRALIDWSHDLLGERERTLFRRLSVFAGGWSLEACSEVCAADDFDGWEVFDLLESLIAKSLVIADDGADEPRYRMLDSTTDYARERLAASAEENRLARKHASQYAKYLRDLRVVWEAMNDLGWKRAVLAELDNLRAALDWTLRDRHDCKVGLEILSLIIVPALIFDHHEARSWYGLGFACVNEIADEVVATAFRCRYAATLTRVQAPVTGQVVMCESNVAAAEQLENPLVLADALRVLGVAYWRASRLEEAGAAFARACDVLPAEQTALRSRIVIDWANNDIDRGDVESARRRFLHVRRIARAGSQMHAIALMGLAETESSVGTFEQARILAHEAAAEFRALGMTMHYGAVSCNLASYAMEQGSLAEARDSLLEALRVFRELGLAHWLTLVLERHAVFAALTHDDQTATLLLGYAERQDALLGRIRQPGEQRGYDRAVALLRQRLGDGEFARRVALGADLSEDGALASATDLTCRPPNHSSF